MVQETVSLKTQEADVIIQPTDASSHAQTNNTKSIVIGDTPITKLMKVDQLAQRIFNTLSPYSWSISLLKDEDATYLELRSSIDISDNHLPFDIVDTDLESQSYTYRTIAIYTGDYLQKVFSDLKTLSPDTVSSPIAEYA